MVVDKPDWSQASYQEMNDLVIRQGARIAELEKTEYTMYSALSRCDSRIAELEACLQILADICGAFAPVQVLQALGHKGPVERARELLRERGSV